MPELITINDKNYVVGITEDKKKEICGLIDCYMGDEFARYVDDYISDLIVKANEEYWKSHTDEQAYEEELNEMCRLLDELWDYFAGIKMIASSKYKKMPEWGYIAEEGMDLINKNR